MTNNTPDITYSGETLRSIAYDTILTINGSRMIPGKSHEIKNGDIFGVGDTQAYDAQPAETFCLSI